MLPCHWEPPNGEGEEGLQGEGFPSHSSFLLAGGKSMRRPLVPHSCSEPPNTEEARRVWGTESAGKKKRDAEPCLLALRHHMVREGERRQQGKKS